MCRFVFLIFRRAKTLCHETSKIDAQKRMFSVETVAIEADQYVREFFENENGDSYDEDHELLKFVRTSPVPRRIETKWDTGSCRWSWFWSRYEETEHTPIELDNEKRWQYWKCHADKDDGDWIPLNENASQRLEMRRRALNTPPS